MKFRNPYSQRHGVITTDTPLIKRRKLGFGASVPTAWSAVSGTSNKLGKSFHALNVSWLFEMEFDLFDLHRLGGWERAFAVHGNGDAVVAAFHDLGGDEEL